MSFRTNLHKQEWIERVGVTAGLPLFEQKIEPSYKLPDWIWDGSDIKNEIYRSLKEKFAEDAVEYLRGIIFLGGSATDHEVKDILNWPLHIVSARRNDLKKLGLIVSYPDKNKVGPAGVLNTIWFVNFQNLRNILEIV